MTLLIGIAAPWGMWQSSDHRLTEWPGGRLITDSSMKHLSIKAPDGLALLSYTGFGRIDGEDVSDWLRKTLRGEDRGLERTTRFIADRATARMGNIALELGIFHGFVVSAFLRANPSSSPWPTRIIPLASNPAASDRISASHRFV